MNSRVKVYSTNNMRAYLYQGSKIDIQHSSSGGAFTGIIDSFYRQNPEGVCYGAAFDENYNVVHLRADTREKALMFRTSKYCFSSYSEALKRVQRDLLEKQSVLFSGTPCQIMALKKYLDKNSISKERLLTVDILCHGSPEAKWWQEYRKWLEKKRNSSISFFSFRWKKAHWHGYSMCAELKNGKRYVNTHDLQVYMDLYFSHLIMRKSCYACQFAKIERVSDITLGDFWGCDKVMPNVLSQADRRKGVSLVLTNTEKGQNIWEELKKCITDDVVLQECPSNKYVEYQTALRCPVHKPDCIKQFEEDYINQGFDYILKKYAGYNLKGHLRFVIKKTANLLRIIK